MRVISCIPSYKPSYMVRMGHREGPVDPTGIKFTRPITGISRPGENRKFRTIPSTVLMGIVIKGLANTLYFVKPSYMVRMEHREEPVDLTGIRFTRPISGIARPGENRKFNLEYEI